MKNLFWLVLALLACQSNTGDHGHPHDNGHAHSDEKKATITQLTEKLELYSKYHPLVLGKTSEFQTFLTVLKDYRPLDSASVTISLVQGSKGIRQTVDEAVKPGVYYLSLRPVQPGIHDLIFDISSPGLKDRVVFGNVEVFESSDEAEAALGEDEVGLIEFKKEQAWNIDFNVAPVERRKLTSSIQTSAEVHPHTSAINTLSAPVAGIVEFVKDLEVGEKVDNSQHVFNISGKEIVGGVTAEENLRSAYRQARANLWRTESELKRQKELLKDSAISQSEFEEFQLRYDLALAEFEEISNNYEEGAIKVYNPGLGFIKELHISPGQYVQVGAPLATILIREGKLLRVDFPKEHLSKTEHISGLRIKDRGNWTPVKADVHSIEKTIEEGSPFVGVYFQTDLLHIYPGEFYEVEVLLKDSFETLSIPKTALLEDFGRYSAVVQKSGEQYELREIEPGVKGTQWVSVTGGLQPGERVVSTGAYQVKMVATKGAGTGHGHVH